MSGIGSILRGEQITVRETIIGHYKEKFLTSLKTYVSFLNSAKMQFFETSLQTFPERRRHFLETKADFRLNIKIMVIL
jgi:hypothetical protein